VRTALERAGYEIGFTNGTGPTALVGGIDRFDIGRHMIERDVSNAHLLTTLALPRLAARHPWHLSPGVTLGLARIAPVADGRVSSAS
jgi:hypothetical protein